MCFISISKDKYFLELWFPHRLRQEKRFLNVLCPSLSPTLPPLIPSPTLPPIHSTAELKTKLNKIGHIYSSVDHPTTHSHQLLQRTFISLLLWFLWELCLGRHQRNYQQQMGVMCAGRGRGSAPENETEPTHICRGSESSAGLWGPVAGAAPLWLYLTG